MSDVSDWEAALTDEEEARVQNNELERKKAEEKKKSEEKQKLKKDAEDFEKLDAKARKLKLREIELRNDAQNTLDLFGVSPTKETLAMTNTAKIDVQTVPEIQPAVNKIIDSLEISDKVEVEFYQALTKELLKELDYFSIREITSVLDTMANEKQRQEKGGKKKKKKAQVNISRTTDMREFEDFM